MRAGFIGVGNMGGAILTAYAASPQGQMDRIMICDKNRELAEERLATLVNGAMTDQLRDLVKASDIVVFGVKPQGIDPVLEEVAKVWTPEKIAISMAAGVSVAHIRGFLGARSKVVRIMPNTPAQVGEGMIAVCIDDTLSLAEQMKVEAILEPAGKTELVDERLIDCVIGVSGSSPAYTFMYIEALAQAAVANGMVPAQARVFAAQAVLGAAKLVLESTETLEQLRIDVCSPGGTTIKAVEKLEAVGFMDDVKAGFQAAVDRSKEMTRQKG